MHEDHMMSSCMVFTRDMSKLPCFQALYTIKTRQSSLHSMMCLMSRISLYMWAWMKVHPQFKVWSTQFFKYAHSCNMLAYTKIKNQSLCENTLDLLSQQFIKRKW